MSKLWWVRKLSAKGNSYYVPHDINPMPIANDYFKGIIYIYSSKGSAEEGGLGGASGFLLQPAIDFDGQDYIYAVTNAHCLEDIKKEIEENSSGECVIRFNTTDGSVDTIEAPLDQWYKHPEEDDVAVFIFKPSDTWAYKAFPASMLIRQDFVYDKQKLGPVDVSKYPNEYVTYYHKSENQWLKIPKIGIGESVTTIGKFAFHGGKSANYPVARFGHISMLPKEPIDGHYSFLVETHSIGGMSGSPVFIQSVVHIFKNKDDEEPSESNLKVFILGVDWGHFNSPDSDLPSGMMCVVPGWELHKLISVLDTLMQGKDMSKVAKKKVTSTPKTVVEPLTQTDYLKILKQVSRKTKKPKQN